MPTVRARIRAQIKRSPPTATPGVITGAVLRELPRAEMADALRVALPYLVRDEIRKIRHQSVGAADTRGRYTWEELEPPPLPTHVTGPERRAHAQKATWAAQAKREREQQLLDTRVALTSGGWKQLRDCTSADLRDLAAGVRERAAENVRRAQVYERLADDMDARQISRVGDFDEVSRVRQAFAAAA